MPDLNEFAIVVDEPQDRTQFGDVLGMWGFHNGFHLGWYCLNAFLGDQMTQVLNRVKK